MDKQFWVSIQNNNYKIPAGYSVGSLSEELFSSLGSTDPELRDAIGLEAFYYWLNQGLYTSDELHNYVLRLVSNLQVGIGKVEDDSVFLRSFSALWLALIVQFDNETKTLEKSVILPILDAALLYFSAEADLRGVVEDKGFAHAIAHASDLFGALAHSRHTDTSDYFRILKCIAKKLEKVQNRIFIYNEDSRLARAILKIFTQNALTLDQIKEWCTSLSQTWTGAWQNESSARVYANGRNLLQSLYWHLMMSQEAPIQNKKMVMRSIQETLEQSKPWQF